MATVEQKTAGPVLNETEASAGSRRGIVRYVLGISFGLAVVAMVIAYAVA